MTAFKQRIVVPLTADEVAGTFVYSYVFSYYCSPIYLCGVLRSYFKSYISSRLGGKSLVVYDCYHNVSCYAEVRAGGKRVADFKVSATEGALKVIELDESAVGLNELRQILEVAGSIALGVGISMLDVLQQQQMLREDCVGCWQFVETVEKALNVVSQYRSTLLPDMGVYDRVKELVVRGGLPFHSHVDIDKEDYVSFLLLAQRASNAIRRMGADQNNKVDEPLQKMRYSELGTTASIYILPHLGTIEIWFGMFDVRAEVEKGRLFVVTVGGAEAEYIDRLVEALRNWLHHAVNVIDIAVKRLESVDVPREYVGPVIDYLRAWRDLLIKYGSKIEENKMIH
ncbi:MAG: hypothetical protein QXD83_04160 [Sulfolobales archaeon]